jgi:hypothetical protein
VSIAVDLRARSVQVQDAQTAWATVASLPQMAHHRSSLDWRKAGRMATKENGEESEETESEDVLDPVTKEKVAHAEARKKIAEADLAAATARLPKLPATLPSSDVDATGLDASFASVNCYRAALGCVIEIVKEVNQHLPGDDAVVWVSGVEHTDAFDAINVVDSSLGDVEATLTAALEELAVVLRLDGNASATSDNGDQPRTLVPLALPPAALAVSAISAGLPLLFDALSSKLTVKSSSTSLDDSALLDLVSRQLLTVNRQGKCAIEVLRADLAVPVDEAYATRVRSAQDKIRELRRRARRAGDEMRTLTAEIAGRVTELDLAKTFVQELVKKSDIKAYPENDVARVRDLAVALAPDQARAAALSSRMAFADEVASAAEKGLLALSAHEPGKTSLLARASFAKRLEDATAGSQWLRLTVDAVDAGATSTVVDNKVAHDRAIHLGSATVTFRLSNSGGEVLCANTYVDTAGSIARLDDGNHSWLARK